MKNPIDFTFVVLIMENVPKEVELLKYVVSKVCHDMQVSVQIYTADRVSEGIRLYEEYHPHLVLLDIGLVGSNGYDFIEHLVNTIPEPDRLQNIAILTGENQFYANPSIGFGEKYNDFRQFVLTFLPKPYGEEEIIDKNIKSWVTELLPIVSKPKWIQLKNQENILANDVLSFTYNNTSGRNIDVLYADGTTNKLINVALIQVANATQHLPNFVRITKQVIINFDYLSAFKKMTNELTFLDKKGKAYYYDMPNQKDAPLYYENICKVLKDKGLL